MSLSSSDTKSIFLFKLKELAAKTTTANCQQLCSWILRKGSESHKEIMDVWSAEVRSTSSPEAAYAYLCLLNMLLTCGNMERRVKYIRKAGILLEDVMRCLTIKGIIQPSTELHSRIIQMVQQWGETQTYDEAFVNKLLNILNPKNILHAETGMSWADEVDLDMDGAMQPVQPVQQLSQTVSKVSTVVSGACKTTVQAQTLVKTASAVPSQPAVSQQSEEKLRKLESVVAKQNQILEMQSHEIKKLNDFYTELRSEMARLLQQQLKERTHPSMYSIPPSTGSGQWNRV